MPDWKKAIAEMARVTNPRGLGWLYLIVNTEPMRVRDGNENVILELGNFQLPELLDVLEANRFSPNHLRQIVGNFGIGQAGGTTRRAFLRARFMAEGIKASWREMEIRSALTSFSRPGRGEEFNFTKRSIR